MIQDEFIVGFWDFIVYDKPTGKYTYDRVICRDTDEYIFVCIFMYIYIYTVYTCIIFLYVASLRKGRFHGGLVFYSVGTGKKNDIELLRAGLEHIPWGWWWLLPQALEERRPVPWNDQWLGLCNKRSLGGFCCVFCIDKHEDRSNWINGKANIVEGARSIS